MKKRPEILQGGKVINVTWYPSLSFCSSPPWLREPSRETAGACGKNTVTRILWIIKACALPGVALEWRGSWCLYFSIATRRLGWWSQLFQFLFKINSSPWPPLCTLPDFRLYKLSKWTKLLRQELGSQFSGASEGGNGAWLRGDGVSFES